MKTADEWMRKPTWHGSYSDYVRHVRGVQKLFLAQQEQELADKIAARVAEKLKGRR